MDPTNDSRIDIHTYFLIIARATALRATCPRRAVGTVLVEGGRIVATGYNGSLPDHPHCTEEGCLIHEGHCIRTIHSEANAEANCIGNADTAYCTDLPCISCLKLLLAHGVRAVYYERDDYVDPARDKFINRTAVSEEVLFVHQPLANVILEVTT